MLHDDRWRSRVGAAKDRSLGEGRVVWVGWRWSISVSGSMRHGESRRWERGYSSIRVKVFLCITVSVEFILNISRTVDWPS